MAEVNRHLIDSDLAEAIYQKVVCPVDAEEDRWGEAAAVVTRARECRLWRH